MRIELIKILLSFVTTVLRWLLPVIHDGAITFTDENCVPFNGMIDPGETVSMGFELQNVGTADTTNLVATLLETGGITSPSGPQSYGALIAGGPADSREFTFTPNGVCGENLVATFSLKMAQRTSALCLSIFPQAFLVPSLHSAIRQR